VDACGHRAPDQDLMPAARRSCGTGCHRTALPSK
jgi:hypothetical protein